MTSPTPTPIRTLLVANRGEIARRILRTARAMGMATVAVYSDADADSPHVAEADLAVRLPGVSPADTYLRVDLILDAASRCAADAVHPGYGFLSESGPAARAVTGAGLIWVGPTADAIDAMGSKVLSKEMMRAAGVPTLPSITVVDDQLPAPEEVDALGWPLLVKASAGGGGRGMRVVPGPDDLSEALAGARREALSAFGDGTVFLERYIMDPRHIEVQILADRQGETVALFERECSVQRRHQKIIEEAPSPVVTPALRARLTQAALNAARAVDYVNAGTVEFVLDREGDPYFLEMNTRLQVEHPVTEAVTGLDLVRLQLLIASGLPLPAEVHAAVETGPVGHAIEARLYAEDPGAGWMPSVGTLHRFETPTAGPGLRVDSGVESGSVVSPHYDPMLAKVIVHAPTRDEAAAALATTLADSRFHGVTTNRDLLVRTLRHPSFRQGDTDTGFLDRFEGLADPLADRSATHRHALAAALAAQARRRSEARVQPNIPSGFRNSPSVLQTAVFDSHFGVVTVGYRFDRFDLSGKRLSRVEIDGSPVDVEVESMTPEGVSLTAGGVTRGYRVELVGATATATTTAATATATTTTAYVDGPDGASTLVEHDRFPDPGAHVAPGSSLAPMPGGVVRVAVAVGDEVKPGQLLVVLEAMKMEHAVHAAAAGKVSEVSVSVGDQVETGRVLVVVEGADE